MTRHRIYADAMLWSSRINHNNCLKKMKNIFKITLGLLACLVVAAGCDDKDDAVKGFSFDKNEIAVAAGGGVENIVVTADGNWSASVSAAWLSISPSNGVGNAVCEVKIDSSLVNDMRSADIRFVAGYEEKVVSVSQFGFDKAISLKDTEIEIEAFGEYGKRFFETTVTSNVEFNVEFEYVSPETDWVSVEKFDIDLDYGARPRKTSLHFDWEMNGEPVERIVKIHFVPIGEENAIKEPAVLTLRQKPAVKIEDNRAGDSIALLTLNDLMNCWSDAWDTSERMDNWEGVTLWKETDEDLPCEEAIGRVRSVLYSFLATKETLPKQVKHLKYLESLSVRSNSNILLLSIELCPEIGELEYLKKLSIFSYGLVSLPAEFEKLGDTLEELDLSANNFNEIPPMLTPEKFGKLKKLNLVSNRRKTVKLKDKGSVEDGIGLNIVSSERENNQLRQLFLWENLEELRLSHCYLEGQLPDFTVGEEDVKAYTQADVDKFGGDTIQWLADNKIPKILPKIKSFSVNLNYFTGKLPDWLLYHPNLMQWAPQSLIFMQYENGEDSEGNKVGFDNTPANFEYYYEKFPLMRGKYEIEEEMAEE